MGYKLVMLNLDVILVGVSCDQKTILPRDRNMLVCLVHCIYGINLKNSIY